LVLSLPSFDKALGESGGVFLSDGGAATSQVSFVARIQNQGKLVWEKYRKMMGRGCEVR
jgi:hypothetical protein